VNSTKSGRLGETIAMDYLRRYGYRIVESNYRCALGEIDVIATEGKTVVFIEVKSRKTERFGEPQAAVGLQKQKKISMVAQNYLKEKKLNNVKARFDVVAVRLLPQGPKVELIRNAFESSYGF
jgi:putative endonuclease